MRNYNLEMKDGNERKYMYSFDEGVIHGYMIKAFSPFFRKGNVLELGSFKGSFTERLAKIFDDITCIEASEEAIEEAKQKKFTNVKLICSSFQEAEINEKFDNIILTHVLEHIDDRIDFLKCDIEGGEYELFQSLPLELISKIDRIAIETHDEVKNENFFLPGKTRRSFHWNFGGGTQTMFYFV